MSVVAQTGSRVVLGHPSRASLHHHLATVVDRFGAFVVFAELLFACAVLAHADLLTPAFRQVILIASFGFLVHQALPVRHRLTGFWILCVIVLAYVMGGSAAPEWSAQLALRRTGLLVVAAGVLIALFAAPLRFWTAALLLAGAAGILAVLRVRPVGPVELRIVWPVLAGLFMFRGIAYFYERSTLRQRPHLSQVASYFALFPNVCSGFFPVIGFKTFVRSHYDGDGLAIYQRGARLIVRGLTQLMIYRVVQQLFALRVEDVSSGTDLAQFILANSFLYLNVSGQFHLFIGLLALFGFNLPDANHRYFLASSFTDYWRRVNIYWKEFVLSVFYYPAFFRLRTRGTTFALVMATAWAFFVTWALHLYQTYWLKGAASVTWPDTIFWSALGLLVLCNSLLELKRGRERKLSGAAHTTRSAVMLALRTAVTFAAISILWSLWSAPTVAGWLGMWRFADAQTVFWAAMAMATIVAATLYFEVLAQGPADTMLVKHLDAGAFMRSAALGLASLFILYSLNSYRVQQSIDTPELQPLIDALNTGESMMDGRGGGYYEHLMSIDPANSQLWEALNREPMPPQYDGADPVQPVRDYRLHALLPNVHVAAYDTDFSTNRWGMRDRDYTLAKPPNTIRIALLGSSHVMGWGVPAADVFESIVERRLNEDHAWNTRKVRFEILNFAQQGASALAQIAMLEKRAAAFQPDIVLLVTHSVDYDWTMRDLQRTLKQGVPITNNLLLAALRAARVNDRTAEKIALSRLKPYASAVLESCYRQIARRAVSAGALPVAIVMPIPAELPLKPGALAAQQDTLSQANFITLDFAHVFDGYDPAVLTLNEPLRHSTIKAHAVIADALYRALLADPRIDLIGRAARPATGAASDVRRALHTATEGSWQTTSSSGSSPTS